MAKDTKKIDKTLELRRKYKEMVEDPKKIDKALEIVKDFKKGWLPYQIAVERFGKATGLKPGIAEVFFNQQRKYPSTIPDKDN